MSNERQKVEFKYTCYTGDEINFVLDKEVIHASDLIKGFFNWAQVVYGWDVEKAYQEDVDSPEISPTGKFDDPAARELMKKFRESVEKEFFCL